MAGNARFHDKIHRKNHHTNPTVGYADSATDPIASPAEPFQGDFVLNGKLSTNSELNVLSANITHDIYCENIHITDVTYTNYISGNSTESIISDGSSIGHGNNTLTLKFGNGIYAETPLYSISNTLSVNGELNVVSPSILSSVNANNSVYLDYPTYGSVDTLVQNATLTVRSSSDAPVSIITSSDTNSSNIRSFRSRGDLSSKTSVSANDTIFGIRGYAHNGTDYNGYEYGGVAAIVASSEGDQTVSNSGGYLTFHTNSSSTVNSLSERVRITGSGNVGIGTNNPSTKIHIKSSDLVVSTIETTNLTGGTIQMFANPDGDMGYVGYGSLSDNSLSLHNKKADSIYFGTDDYIQMTILSSGNVGIGNLNPDVKLDVIGDIAGDNIISRNSSTAETTISLIREGGLTDQKNWQLIHLNDGTFGIKTVDDAGIAEDYAFSSTRAEMGHGINDISLGTNFETRLHITSAGKIGFGTQTPQGNLHIRDASDSRYASIVLGSNNDYGFHITNESHGNGLGIWTGSVGSGNTKLYILTGGEIGIGTTTPSQKLHVEGSIYANGSIRATGDLFIEGSLSALGDVSIIDTNIISTSSLSVINHGTTEALMVNQIGNYPIAKFQKDGIDALVIEGTNVTVYDTLTAKTSINSPNINLLQSTSSNWDSAYTTVSTTSSQWMTGGDTVDYKLRSLTVTDTVSTIDLRVVNSLYLPVSTLTATSAVDTYLDIYSPTYLFMKTDGYSAVNVFMPNVDYRHIGLTFYMRNLYGDTEPISDIKIKNAYGSDLYYISKLGQIPNYIQLIWDGNEWQQILLV